MKRYILLNEEELTNLGKGEIVEQRLTGKDTVCFMCPDRHEEGANEDSKED